MELREFISKVLIDIAAGVDNARSETGKLGVQIGLPLYYNKEGAYLTASNTGAPRLS